MRFFSVRAPFSSMKILCAAMMICWALSHHSTQTFAQSDDAFDTDLLIEDGGNVIALRPKELTRSKTLRTMVDTWRYLGIRLPGFNASDIEEAVAVESSSVDSSPPQIICQVAEDIEIKSKFLQQFVHNQVWKSDPELVTHHGESYFRGIYPDDRPEGLKGETVAAWQPDPFTIMINNDAGIKSFIDGTKPKQKLLASEEWKAVRDFSAAGIFDASAIRRFIDKRESDRTRYLEAVAAFRKKTGKEYKLRDDTENIETENLLRPLIERVDRVAYGLDIKSEIEILAMIACKTPADAQKAVESIEKLRELFQPWLSFQMESAEGMRKRVRINMLKLQLDLLANAKVTRNGNAVRIVSSADGEVLVPGSPEAIADQQEMKFRLKSEFNGKHVGLAFHNYHDTFKKMPPAIGYGPKGHAFSWRVAVLPFMGEEGRALHAQYDFEADWDSEANLKVLAQMPDFYRNPKDAPDSTNTSYQALYGPGSMMWKEGGTLGDIIDGTSNTIAYVESKTSIPWTKPEDIAYDPFDQEKLATKLGGYYEGGFHAVMGDGTTLFIDDLIKEEHLHWMIQMDDRKSIPR